jgi:hypothetical protein
MRILISIFIVFISGCATNKIFQQTLVELAGENSNGCGFFQYRSDTAPGFKCAKNSIDSSEPFWLGIQEMGIDSDVWFGFAQSKAGSLYKVDFDSDITGGRSSTEKPRLTVLNCEKWQIEEDGEILCNTH